MRNHSQRFSRLPVRNRVLISAVLFLGGVAISIALHFAVKASIENEAYLQFQRQASDAHHKIEARVRSYIDVVHGLGALFRTTKNVPRAQFHNYVTGLRLPERFPGFQLISYAEEVAHNDKARFEQRVKGDRDLTDLGYPAFRITPPGARSSYHVLTYQEPMKGNEITFGVDIGAAPERRAALDRIRDTGELFSSGRPVVVSGPNAHVALAMRLPVYRADLPLDTVEQRRAAFTGTLGAAFRITELMRGVLNPDVLNYMSFTLHDAGPQDRYRKGARDPKGDYLLFDSAQLVEGGMARSQVKTDLETILPMYVAGRVWEIHYRAPSSAIVSARDLMSPWMLLGGGVLISLLLSAFAYSLATSRSRAMALAREITKDLQQSETSLAEAQRIARLGNWSLDMSTNAMNWSAETYRILGLDTSEEARRYEDFLQHLHEDDREVFQAALTRAAQSGRDSELEHRIAAPDGSVSWVHSIIRPANSDSGPGIQGTIRDITERKLAAIRLEIEHRVTQLASSTQEIEEFMPAILRALCEGTGWDCGLFWRRDEEEEVLRCAIAWANSETRVKDFLAHSRKLRVTHGMDVPGQAWAESKTVFIGDMGLNEGLVRESTARQSGLRATVALPIVAATRFCGVIELYSSTTIEADDSLWQLLDSVRNQIGQYFERKNAEETLRYIAAHDSLTGLPNRGMFNDRLRHALDHAGRYKKALAVLFVDIDRFKMLNDTLGHSAGDDMLIACSKRLSECIRGSDLVARLGGDEFVIMVENFTTPRDVIAVAQKVLFSLARPFMIGNRELLITASIGISAFPDDGMDADTLLKNADIAMYRAKDQGRNNYQFYSAQMNTHTFERLAMETSLRRAVERNEFLVHYQPKVDLRTEAITGVEALVRWQHPDWGMVSPLQFVPLAEETGLISKIGERVLETACEQSRRWRDAGIAPMRMAVNLSARQFNQESLLRDIAGVIARSGITPELLELEITESMVMQNPEHAAQTLGKLKAMGIRLAIDDFGTGYSSLAYLKRFPIDAIKLDRSFVKDIPNDVDDMAIARGVIALGHSLRLRVVAEGVETPEQKVFLAANLCDEMQGFLFSKPLPADEMTAFLKARSPLPALKIVEPRRRA